MCVVRQLYYDNDPLLRREVDALLDDGFEVDVLPTVEEARTALDTTRWDIVVLDRGLPDGDGLTVLTDMRARGDASPVLILTAHGSLNDRVTGLQSGADADGIDPLVSL